MIGYTATVISGCTVSRQRRISHRKPFCGILRTNGSAGRALSGLLDCGSDNLRAGSAWAGPCRKTNLSELSGVKSLINKSKKK